MSGVSCFLGWLDYLPVVGTVKNGLECLAALSEGQYEEACIKATETTLGAIMDVASFGLGHMLETALMREGEKILMKELTANAEKAIINVTVKGGGREAAVPTTAMLNQLQNEPTREMISLGQIGLMKLNKNKKGKGEGVSRKEQKEPEEQKKRGDHVINNNVLKICKQIIDGFIDEVNGHKFDQLRNVLRPDSHVAKAYDGRLLDERTRNDIQYEMVVVIGHEYVDVNAYTYGGFANTLKKMIVDYMKGCWAEGCLDPKYQKEHIYEVVNHLNNGEIYVDHVACAEYLGRQPNRGRQEIYNNAKKQVADMFRLFMGSRGKDMVDDWLDELRMASRRIPPH